MGEEEIAAFLNHLATAGGVSASTQNQALHSLLFLYRQILKRDIGLVPGLTPAKRGHRLPVVLSVSEVRTVLSKMRGVPRLCATLMYGSGLRLSECTNLRIKDIDFDRREIMVRGGKGDKDRRVPLPQLATRAQEQCLAERRSLSLLSRIAIRVAATTVHSPSSRRTSR